MPPHSLRAKSFLLVLNCMSTSSLLFHTSEPEVKCFCDKTHCPGALVCTGKWCLIGVRNEDGHGKLDQECGKEGDDKPVDCTQHWGKWSELCVCKEDFCNTFAYLRGKIDRRNTVSREHQVTRGDAFGSLYGDVDESRIAGEPRDAQNDDRNQMQQDTASLGQWGIARPSGTLVLLLVIVPLSVGGFSMCLIFLNYHCKML